MVCKNRRNVKGYGYIRDLNQGCCNVELREDEIEDICWEVAGIVSLKEP